MSSTLKTPYTLESGEELGKLPIQSVVIIREDEFGDHVAWQLSNDVLNPKTKGLTQAWSSSYYETDHCSKDLLAMSYDGKATVVYVHPTK